MGRVSRGTYGRPFGCLDDTKKKKDEFQSHPLSLKANPYQRRKFNRTAWLPSFFSFFLLDNQAALPSNKWLRVSKQPLPLGRRFAVPLLSGPAAVRHLNSKLRSDPIGSSRLGLVLSDPTQELRTAGPLWTVERGEGSRAHSLSGQRARTFQFQTEYMYMTEQNIKKK